jgi:hypothetical protein
MDKEEIISKLKEIMYGIDTMIAYAENPDLSDDPMFKEKTVSEFYENYIDKPEELADVIKSLQEDLSGMKMSEFVRK